MTIRAFASKHGINPSIGIVAVPSGVRPEASKVGHPHTFIDVVKPAQPVFPPASLMLQVQALGVCVEVDASTDLHHLRQVLEAFPEQLALWSVTNHKAYIPDTRSGGVPIWSASQRLIVAVDRRSV